MEGKVKKVLEKVLIVGFILTISCTMLATPVRSATKSSLNTQLTETQKDIQSAKKDLEGVESAKSATLKEINKLNGEITAAENKITALNKEINSIKKDITKKEKEIADKQELYEENMDKFKTRLVATYKMGETTYLDVLLSSKKITEVLSNWYYLSEIAEADKALLKQIDSQKTELENAKAKLQKDKAKVESNKKSVEKEEKALTNSKNAKSKIVSKLSLEEKAINKELEELEKIQKKIKKELEELANKNQYVPQKPNKYGYISPLAGRTTRDIYCGWNGYPGHTGVDFSYAGINGQNILAVKSGTVVKSTALRNSSGTYISYGEYIVIDHHDGSMTLYAHGLAGSRRVDRGQKVSQGQVIMRVGSTGNSTGPHLHFEVLINGVAVNPTPYLP